MEQKNKRKRSDSEDELIETHETKADVDWMGLPEETWNQVLSFLPHSDRLPLAATSRAGLHVVETFSQKIMTKIHQLHRVDGGFEMRLRGPFASYHGDAYIDDDWELPERCRLKAALKSYLYTLMHVGDGLYSSLKMSPTGNDLLTFNRLGAKLWDKESRECLQEFSNDDPSRGSAFFCSGGLIVTCGRDNISVWSSESGELKYKHTIPDRFSYIPLSSQPVVLKDKVFYSVRRGILHSLLMLNVPSQTATVLDAELPESFQRVLRGHLDQLSLIALDDRWLVVHVENFEGPGSDFYVLDGQCGIQKQVGHYHSEHQYKISEFEVQQPQPGELTIKLAARRHVRWRDPNITVPYSVDIFEYDPMTGQFSHISFFDVASNYVRLLGFHGDSLLLQRKDSRAQRLDIDFNQPHESLSNIMRYNIVTGESQEYYWHSTTLGIYGASRSVFCKVKQLEYLCGPRFVAAFLANEPSLDEHDGAATSM